MKTKIEVTDDQAVTLTIDKGGEQSSQWTMAPDQVGKHLRGLEHQDHPWKNVAKGDLDAARDAANETAKQRKS